VAKRHTHRPPFRKSTLREYFESIIIAVVLALFIRTFVVQAFKIPSGSMENNLLIGDHLLVNKFITGHAAVAFERTLLPFGTIARGDILVFKHPDEPERDLIKRVIGLPGETLEMRAKKIYINGQPLDEPYVHFLMPPSASTESSQPNLRERYGPVTLPANRYFMMGDNRDNSEDSRYWGFLPRANVKGKALLIYWSYDANSPTLTRWDRMFRLVH